jgi:hypothetical protein
MLSAGNALRAKLRNDIGPLPVPPLRVRDNSDIPKLKTFYIDIQPVSVSRSRALTVRRSVSGTTRGRARLCRFSATNVSPRGLIWGIYFSCEPLNPKSSSA